MSRLTLVAFFLFALATVGNPRSARAAESYDNCTGFITSLPAVITAPGTWCMNQDLNTAISDGYAIEIASDKVTVDCNSHLIDGTSAGLGTRTYGVFAHGESPTVRHCHIRGFFAGVYIGDSGSIKFSYDTIEDNRLDGNTSIGIASYDGIAFIQRNEVFNTGNSTVPTDSIFGIVTIAPTDIIGNTVSGVTARSGTGYSGVQVYGIIVEGGLVGAPGPPGSVKDNRVRGLTPAGTGNAIGILFSSANRFVLAGNDVVLNGAGSQASSMGLYCIADSKGRVLDNVIAGFDTGIVNCGNAGNNDISP